MGATRFSVSLDHLTNASVIQMQALSVLPEQTAEAEVWVEGGSLTLYLSPQKDFCNNPVSLARNNEENHSNTVNYI